jgi:hypothetical protein
MKVRLMAGGAEVAQLGHCEIHDAEREAGTVQIDPLDRPDGAAPPRAQAVLEPVRPTARRLQHG